MTKIKSQLAALQGKAATAPVPQSQLARFVFGEVKGGEARHDYAMSTIHAAIVQALKGNCRDIPEAVKFCQGKSQRARAYFAGFHAIADSVKPVLYAGKLDSPENKEVRELIHTSGQRIAAEFEIAYLAMLEQAKEEGKAARATKAAEKAEAGNVAGAVADVASAETGASVATVAAAEVDVGDLVATVCRAIGSGLLSEGERAELAAALTLAAAAAAPELAEAA